MCDETRAFTHTHTRSQTDSQAPWSMNNEHSIGKKWQNNYIATFAFDFYFIFFLINSVIMCTALECVCVCVRAITFLAPLVIVNLDLHKIFRDAFVCALYFITKSMHLSMQLVHRNWMRKCCRLRLNANESPIKSVSEMNARCQWNGECFECAPVLRNDHCSP